MLKIARLAGFLLLVLIAAIGAAAGFLLYTAPGRDTVARIAEPLISDALGGTARLGRLSGAPPWRIIVEDVELADAEGTWLTLDRASLSWRPFALLGRAVSVEALEIEGVRLEKIPNLNSEEKTPSDAPPAGFELPEKLPTVSIRGLSFTDVHVAEAIAGRAFTIAGKGALDMGAKGLDARLDAASSDGADAARIQIGRDPTTGRIIVDAVIDSRPGGGIAALAGADGAVSVSVKADAPAKDFTARVLASAAPYGDVAGVLGADLTTRERLTVDATISPGEAAADITDTFSPALEISGEIRPVAKGLDIAIARLAGDGFELTGEGGWRNDRRGLKTAMLEARLGADGEQFSTFTDYLGQEVSITADLARENADYRLSAIVDSPRARVEAEDIGSDLRTKAQGPLRIVGRTNEALPAPLAQGFDARSNVAFERDAKASLSNIILNIGGARVLEGEGSYDLKSGRIDAKGRLTADAEIIAAAAPSLAAQGIAALDFAVAGLADDFSLTVKGETPAMEMGGASDEEGPAEIPAARIDIALAGLPAQPSGRARAAPAAPAALNSQTSPENPSEDGDKGVVLEIETDADGVISAPRLTYRGAGFDLTASGQYDPARGVGALEATYRGGPGASPAPGVKLAGGVSLDAELTPEAPTDDDDAADGRRLALSIKAGRLIASGTDISGLDLTAEGGLDAVEITARAGAIRTPGATLAKLDAAGRVDLAGGATARLERFSTFLEGLRVTTTEPARIAFTDGIAVDSLALDIGEKGRLELAAAFAPTRWRLDLMAKDAPNPWIDAVADIDISLDTDSLSTDEKTLARGRVALTPLALGEKPAPIAVKGLWDGQKLALADAPADTQGDAEGDGALDLKFSAPLALSRAPRLSVSTEGPLDGRISFDGRLESLARLIPGPLQTMEGALVINARIAGDTSAPNIDGALRIKDGAYTELVSGLSLEKISGEASSRASPDGAEMTFAFSAAGAGQDRQSVDLKGEARIGEDAALNAVLTLDNAVFSASPVESLRASGEISLAGALDALKASGAIDIAELDAALAAPPATGLVPIEVVQSDAVNEDAATPEDLRRDLQNTTDTPQPAAGAASIALDIAIRAPRRLFVRGLGIESEWSAALDITGASTAPVVLGNLGVRRGSIDFAGRRFNLTQGAVRFDRLTANNPSLDLRAEYATPEDVTAAITVGGRARSPSISLESTPSLPQEDIMALVLFGKPANQLSAFESLQVAQALAQLAGINPIGGGGPGLTGNARAALGLDMLNVDLDSDTGASALSVGKYVADGLFISATQNARGDEGAVRVEYELTDSITVETELRQDGDQLISTNWKRDF